MTKSELIDRARQDVDIMKDDAQTVVEQMFQAISQEIQENGKFSYPGFGTLEVRERAAREGRNPRTGEAIQIDASKTVALKPAGALKEAVNSSAV